MPTRVPCGDCTEIDVQICPQSGDLPKFYFSIWHLWFQHDSELHTYTGLNIDARYLSTKGLALDVPTVDITAMNHQCLTFGWLIVALVLVALTQADYNVDDSNSTIQYHGPWSHDTLNLDPAKLFNDTVLVVIGTLVV